jgi:hypothetical protein
VIIFDVNIAGLEGCCAGSEINGNCAFGNWDRPEQTAFGDPRIEIVNLIDLAEVEYVKSYEREGAMVIASIGADELAAHKAHVGLEGKVLRGLTNYGMGARTSYCGPAHVAVEVGDRRRFGAWTWQKNMEQRSAWTEQLQTAGNRNRSSGGCAVGPVSFERGCPRQFRHHARRSQHAQRNPGLFQKASTAQQSFSEVGVTWIRHRG